LNEIAFGRVSRLRCAPLSGAQRFRFLRAKENVGLDFFSVYND
jgi:hypothetical protein